MEKTYYDITKEYPNMYRVMIYKTPYSPKPVEKIKRMKKMFDDPLDVSIRRTRRTLHDYVRCNDFTLFVTFTFDPKKVDRYNMTSVYIHMQGWLFRQRQKNKNFKYLVVPEKHKDGAIHFHALIQNPPFLLKKTNVIQDGNRVYNITAFRFGFTNATYLPVDDEEAKEKAGNYIAKYIAKDMITLSNKRRYWASKNLNKPTTHYNKIYDLGIAQKINHKTLLTETEFNTVYQVPKDLFDR